MTVQLCGKLRCRSSFQCNFAESCVVARVSSATLRKVVLSLEFSVQLCGKLCCRLSFQCNFAESCAVARVSRATLRKVVLSLELPRHLFNRICHPIALSIRICHPSPLLIHTFIASLFILIVVGSCYKVIPSSSGGQSISD